MSDFPLANSRTFGDAPFFVFCDHASNAMPDRLNCLGLPEDILKTHIAWDVGAGKLAERIAELLGGGYFACGFSRLVVDVNRATHAADIIPATSDQIPIPGNQMLGAKERAARLHDFHAPYHEALEAALVEHAAHAGEPFVIAIHSFTNRLMGASEERPWQVGLLWSDDETSARAMMAALAQQTDWAIGDNEPYDARVFNYSVDRHIAPRELRHVTLEVRQDLLDSEASIDKMAALLAGCISQTAGFD